MPDSAEQTYLKLLEEQGVVTGARRREAITQAAVDFPDHPGIQAMEAERILWTGDLDKCHEILAKAEKVTPEDPNLMSVRALLIGYKGDLVESDRLFRLILDRDPQNRIAMTNYPGILIQLDETDRAKEILAQAEVTHPTNMHVVSANWNAFRMLDDTAKCDEILARVEHIDSDMVAVIKARSAMRLPDIAESERWAREAVAMNPENRSAWEHLSMLLVHKGELQEAKAAANFALELNSRSTPSLQQLAKISLAQGDKRAAQEYEQRAAEAVPFLKDHVAIRKASKIFRSGNIDLALKNLRTLMQAQSAGTRKLAASSVMRILTSTPHYKDAPALILEIEKMGSDTALFFGTKALIQMASGDQSAAFETLDLGLEKFPGNQELLANKLRCLAKIEDRDGCIKLGEQLLESGLRTPTAYVGITATLFDIKLDDLADRFYQDLIRKFPSSTSVEVVEAMRDLQKGHISAGLQKINDLSDRGEMPRPKVKMLPLFGQLGKVLFRVFLYKTGLKKRKKPDDGKDS